MRWLLGVTLASGFLFRLLYLGRRQLWIDELMQGMVVRQSSAAEMLAQLRSGMALPAPLDYFIEKGVVLILGESAWSLRFHAVIFGSLSLWFFYRIGRQLFGERVALYSTILFALYPLHYHYSQEARPYALLVFLSLVSYDLLLRLLAAQKSRPLDWVLLGCVLTLLLYTSFLGILVIASQWIALLLSGFLKLRPAVSGPQDPRDADIPPELPAAGWNIIAKYSLAAFAACVLFIPWVQFAWARPLVSQAAEVADPKLLLRMIKELGDNSYPMSAILLFGVATGVRAMLRHGRRRALIWLATWSMFSIPAVLILVLWSGYFFAIRHILHVTPAFVLLAGYGMCYVGERMTILDRMPYRVSAPSILYVILTLVVSVWIAQSHWKREPVDWLGVSRYLRENVRTGDALAMPQVHAFIEYYHPSLRLFKVEDLGIGEESGGRRYERRYVVCANLLNPDPCSSFRPAANRDPAWRSVNFRGFTVFIRGGQPGKG